MKEYIVRNIIDKLLINKKRAKAIFIAVFCIGCIVTLLEGEAVYTYAEPAVNEEATYTEPAVNEEATQAEKATDIIEDAIADVVEDDLVNLAKKSEEEAIEALLMQYRKSYFDKAVFVGDSIMVGFEKYAVKTTSSPLNQAKFLTATSYSAYHANRGIKKSKLQPSYMGEKRNIWDSIAMMDVDRVFMMFGTNDLIMCNIDTTANNIMSVADKILEVKPETEIVIISMNPVYSTTNKGNLNNASIDILNSQLQALTEEKGYGYVDLNSALKGDDGAIIPSYSSDKYVHQNFNAYGVWDSVFQNYADANIIKEFMKMAQEQKQ